MYNKDLSIQQLMIFILMMEKRKVGDVAEETGLTQPSISRCLAHLRDHFGDALFVRTRRGMEPTPAALEIAPVIEEMVDLYQSRLIQRHSFDPATAKRTFRIAASEIGHALLFPQLIRSIRKIAPSISLEAIPLGYHELISELEAGKTDVAIGAFPKLFSGVYERTLFKENYVCLVREGHPSLGKGKISLTEYQQAQHIIVSVRGLGHIHEQIEKQLLDNCAADGVSIVVHNFLLAARLVEESDCIATVPSRVAAAMGQTSKLQSLKPPFKIPSFEVKQYWHERFHKDQANQWIRRTLAGEFR
jgi:DNA-binding transcriptional LysR family regulator